LIRPSIKALKDDFVQRTRSLSSTDKGEQLFGKIAPNFDAPPKSVGKPVLHEKVPSSYQRGSGPPKKYPVRAGCPPASPQVIVSN
jgi:hypothetical protein